MTTVVRRQETNTFWSDCCAVITATAVVVLQRKYDPAGTNLPTHFMLAGMGWLLEARRKEFLKTAQDSTGEIGIPSYYRPQPGAARGALLMLTTVATLDVFLLPLFGGHTFLTPSFGVGDQATFLGLNAGCSLVAISLLEGFRRSKHFVTLIREELAERLRFRAGEMGAHLSNSVRDPIHTDILEAFVCAARGSVDALDWVLIQIAMSLSMPKSDALRDACETADWSKASHNKIFLNRLYNITLYIMFRKLSPWTGALTVVWSSVAVAGWLSARYVSILKDVSAIDFELRDRCDVNFDRDDSSNACMTDPDGDELPEKP